MEDQALNPLLPMFLVLLGQLPESDPPRPANVPGRCMLDFDVPSGWQRQGDFLWFSHKSELPVQGVFDPDGAVITLLSTDRGGQKMSVEQTAIRELERFGARYGEVWLGPTYPNETGSAQILTIQYSEPPPFQTVIARTTYRRVCGRLLAVQLRFDRKTVARSQRWRDAQAFVVNSLRERTKQP